MNCVSMLRAALGLGLAAASAEPAVPQEVDVSTGSIVNIVSKLHAGQYIWAPEVAPQGPMFLIVNVQTQRAILYRNGVPIGASTVSTGRSGHETPTGVFTILQKHVVHHSSKYDNAPMPYMERLTWKGVALHAGNLPGYPASHGCIRLPPRFAKLLYGQTIVGMTVVVAKVAALPHVAPAPDILTDASAPAGSSDRLSWTPEKSPTGPVSVVVSASDQRALVLRNGVVIGSAPVRVGGPVAGTWAYSLRGIDNDGQHWVRLDLSKGPAEGQIVAREEWQRFSAPDSFKKAIASIVAPGMTIVVTPDSLRSATAPVTVLQSGS